MFKLKENPAVSRQSRKELRTRSTTSTMANSEHMPIDRC